MFSYHQYKQMAAEAERADVTQEEFIAAMLADGDDQASAALQAKVNQELGGHTLIGKRMLRIVTPDNAGEGRGE